MCVNGSRFHISKYSHCYVVVVTVYTEAHMFANSAEIHCSEKYSKANELIILNYALHTIQYTEYFSGRYVSDISNKPLSEFNARLEV
jgi:hypothetical protein